MKVAQGLRGWGSALGLAGVLLAGPLQAQVNPVVVELYTSQGCVSCPPADAAFAEFARDPGVIALALHVDYWDYLGWEDAFAHPAFTERQKRYARAARAKMIYTPQIIVGGTDRVQGARPEEIRAAITTRAAAPPRVVLRLQRQAGGALLVEAVATPPLTEGAVVQLVRYHPQETVQIERGENAGQQVTYHNIVTEWRPLAEWNGQSPLRIESPVEGDDVVVVIIQQAGPGPVLAAARLD